MTERKQRSRNIPWPNVVRFHKEIAESCTEVPEHLQFYIDYERMGRDMDMSGDIFTIETSFDEVHIFLNH